jgi:hypothetical protein
MWARCDNMATEDGSDGIGLLPAPDTLPHPHRYPRGHLYAKTSRCHLRVYSPGLISLVHLEPATTLLASTDYFHLVPSVPLGVASDVKRVRRGY